MASVGEWLGGARPRTWAASASPVIAGASVSLFAPVLSVVADGRIITVSPSDWRSAIPAGLTPFVLCLVVGLGFQIGSNYANDYSDGIRGTDDHRVGPQRLVGSGAAEPRSVRRAAWICFAMACLAGLVLIAGLIIRWSRGMSTGWWQSASQGGVVAVTVLIVLVGLACVGAAWFYTGGRRPYGYAGLGEVFVFIFFGLIATIGTAFMVAGWQSTDCDAPGVCLSQIGATMNWPAATLAGAVMGFFATAILVANNLRDLATDRASGKITLPVRLGDRATRWLFLGLMAGAALGIVALGFLTSPAAWMGLIGVGLAIPATFQVHTGAEGHRLIAVLTRTSLAELVAALGVGFGLAVGGVYA